MGSVVTFRQVISVTCGAKSRGGASAKRDAGCDCA
jgi:hypothetical protein